MKIGLNLLLWTVRLEETDLQRLDVLKEIGFDGVEIPLSPDYSDRFLDKVSRRLQSLDLACSCSAFLPPESSAIHPDPSVRKRGQRQLEQFVNMAARLNSSVVMGPMHSPHKDFPGRGPSMDEKKWCAEVLHKSGEYAQSHDIRLSVEFLNRFECYFLTHSLEAKALVDMVDHPHVGMTYDTHHAHLEDASIHDTIMTCQQSINHIHISESHRGTPGKGLVNWAETFRAIKDIQYDDWLVVEAFGQGNQVLIQGANIWRNCFESEDQLCKEALHFVNEQINFTI
ncbi:MAG: sugar phosphate isomerase/epimerase [Bacteroidota bacterium]